MYNLPHIGLCWRVEFLAFQRRFCKLFYEGTPITCILLVLSREWIFETWTRFQCLYSPCLILKSGWEKSLETILMELFFFLIIKRAPKMYMNNMPSWMLTCVCLFQQGARPSLSTSRRTCFLSSENRWTKIYGRGLQSEASSKSCGVNDRQLLLCK